MKSSDYPLPAAYNRAFDASDRLVCEVDPKALLESSKGILKAGQYPKGDSLKNHVDPRTYDYLRRVFRLLKVPEGEFARYRPWFLSLMLQAPELHGMSETLGVEEFLIRRARANSKPVSGLESAREHADVFLDLTDRQSEAMLLMMFLPAQRSRGSTGDEMARAWRRGDADTDTRIMCLVDSPVPLNFSTQQRPRRDSSKASVRPAGRKRSPGARWREHVCWHVD